MNPAVFSGRRVAYALGIVTLCAAPVHLRVACRASDVLAEGAGLLFLATVILSLLTPRGVRGRFGPVGLGLLATVAHSLLSH